VPRARSRSRSGRTLKDATTRAFHYLDLQELRRHVGDYLTAYLHAKQLKALERKTPYETLHARYQPRAHLFRTSPDHFTPGLYIGRGDWPEIAATLPVPFARGVGGAT
jgi:hypothetical protein